MIDDLLYKNTSLCVTFGRYIQACGFPIHRIPLDTSQDRSISLLPRGFLSVTNLFSRPLRNLEQRPKPSINRWIILPQNTSEYYGFMAVIILNLAILS